MPHHFSVCNGGQASACQSERSSDDHTSPERTPMNTLIRNGKVVTARQTIAADVLIEDEVIKEVRAGIPANSAAKVIDAAGMYVLPGGIDCHTHLDMPFG